jgi:Spy/CpxP family protein refolding chaperone
MMKKLFCLLIAVILIGLAANASAQDKGYGMGERMFPAIGRLLTDDQRKSFQQIIESERGQIRPLEEKMRTSRQALLAQITDGNFNETLANQYAGESAKAEADLMVVFARALSKMQPPLSTEQIAQLKDFQQGHFKASQDASGPTPEAHLKLPPPLPHDTNGLPIVN